ncbi:hypothetical protein ACKI1I_11650 [Streptomyces turgidiscabies]|uniref:Apea-like HEPN domain-containing protein n=1 Tax=Streptomyces turgidiscabies (strain Car8) TaxID=698760 RepID=L7F3Z9_STRT8|nr:MULTISPECIES: hypothetical protein [Streptomyces]ELP65726.1 hypothetical protein STRTUCAR8_01318 [Streptomyces turgidiscabies Car8]MDX3494558.1 hypothetical protein [Streptomyces turgidiscabies]
MKRLSQQEVERRLGMRAVDPHELAWAIANVVQQSQFTSELQVDFPREDSPALTLHYFKKGGLRAIAPGPSLTEEVFTQIEQKVKATLLAPAASLVHRMVLFAHVPTEGYWRYRDKLLIRRAPDEAPRPQMVMGEHPLVFEVAFNGSADWQLRNMRALQEPRQLALLLSLLIPGLTVPPINSRKHWMLDATPGAMRSVWAQETYFIPNFEGYADELSPQGDLPTIEMVAAMPGGVSADTVLVVPQDLEQKLDTFMQLDGEDRTRLLRAAYWLHHAREVWDISKSAYFQSLVQGVEAMLKYPPHRERCTECKAHLEGPTAYFRRFIDRYAPVRNEHDEDEKKARKLLYQKRSDLTHGTSLLSADEEVGLGWHTPKPSYEYQLSSEAQRVCRRAIIGWLDEHPSMREQE